MVQLLRFILIFVGGLCLLVYAVVALSTQLPVFAGELTASTLKEESAYHLNLVDTDRNLRVDLTGSMCDPGPPLSKIGEYAYNGSIGGYPYDHPTVIQEEDGLYIVYYTPFGNRCKL